MSCRDTGPASGRLLANLAFTNSWTISPSSTRRNATGRPCCSAGGSGLDSSIRVFRPPSQTTSTTVGSSAPGEDASVQPTVNAAAMTRPRREQPQWCGARLVATMRRKNRAIWRGRIRVNSGRWIMILFPVGARERFAGAKSGLGEQASACRPRRGRIRPLESRRTTTRCTLGTARAEQLSRPSKARSSRQNTSRIQTQTPIGQPSPGSVSRQPPGLVQASSTAAPSNFAEANKAAVANGATDQSEELPTVDHAAVSW